MVKRPTGIQVSYIDEQGEEIEQSITSFRARVFLHEMDHIDGKTMQVWSVASGNIDFMNKTDNETSQLTKMTTVDYYKQRVEDLKSELE